MTQTPELVEFAWNEHTQDSLFVYESLNNDGLTTEFVRHQPLFKPDGSDALKAKYFAELRWYLETQGECR